MRITMEGGDPHTLRMFDDAGEELDVLDLQVRSLKVEAAAAGGRAVLTLEMMPRELDLGQVGQLVSECRLCGDSHDCSSYKPEPGDE